MKNLWPLLVKQQLVRKENTGFRQSDLEVDLIQALLYFLQHMVRRSYCHVNIQASQVDQLKI